MPKYLRSLKFIMGVPNQDMKKQQQKINTKKLFKSIPIKNAMHHNPITDLTGRLGK